MDRLAKTNNVDSPAIPAAALGSDPSRSSRVLIGRRGMFNVMSIYSDTDGPHRRLIALAMFVVWFGVVSFLAWTHLVWRDEVRALSLALQGDTVFAMLKGLHGEGHPAIWYL